MKNLIYYTIGNNKLFIDLLKKSIHTLNKTDYDGDLLIITDFKEEILKQIEFKNKIYFHEVNKTNFIESSANKFKIYKFSNVNDYDKIIYCDADVLWLKNPNLLYEKIVEDKIYVANERHNLSTKYYNYNMTEEELKLINENNLKGFSAGFFGFNKNCLEIFKILDESIINNPESATWLEQPVLCTYLFRNKLYNTNFNGLVSHIGRTTTSVSLPYDGVALHFGGAIGNYYEKQSYMFKYMLHNRL